ncbi:hypothetical protein QFW77_11520 [Luteimonas sp. RD2P54]|uniref:DUF3108 domain-containing protein n=1 Tax=Luteimonas endophytica TaxID=3042023 RepID=A0ABT6J9V8_9GAMM|nr:hypothetical protein [Luteimonas endophytica]MDH5823616.1 hypothetical protein [Luteimonas endophytica]
MRASGWAAWIAGLALMCAALPAPAAHAVYAGRIGGSDITFVIESRNAVQRAVYFYDRYRTPIRLKPAFLHQSRDFGIDELDAAGMPVARLRFDVASFHRSAPRLTGTWTDYRSGRSLPLVLELVAYLDSDGAWPAGRHPLLQAASTERFYFRVPMARDHAAVEAIEVVDKATGRARQTLALPQPGCNRGMETVQVVLERGLTQLRMEQTAHCPGALFEWDPAAERFEDRLR